MNKRDLECAIMTVVIVLVTAAALYMFFMPTISNKDYKIIEGEIKCLNI